jgi:hypothetical protein
MAGPIWMDFSGAPPILIPERYLGLWNGFYLEDTIDPDEDLNLSGDLVLPDGRSFSVWDEFDFQNPKTDYDRLCGSGHRKNFLHPLGDGHALVLVDYSDGTTGWWPEQQVVLTVSRQLPDPASFDRLAWGDELRWTVPDRRVVLMNSCLHGADPDNRSSDQFVEIDLEPGEYSITTADAEGEWCIVLHRLRRVSEAC